MSYIYIVDLLLSQDAVKTIIKFEVGSIAQKAWLVQLRTACSVASFMSTKLLILLLDILGIQCTMRWIIIGRRFHNI